MGFIINRDRVIPGTSISNPANWLTNLFYEPTKAGVDVTEDTAMKLSAFWACVTLIMGTVATESHDMYKRTEDGKEKRTDHYLHPILHDQYNPRMNAFQAREFMTYCLLVWGNSYWWKDVDPNTGKLVALWPLMPWNITPRLRDEKNKRSEIVYEYSNDDGMSGILFADEIFHVMGPSNDGIAGMSVIEFHAETIAGGIAMRDFSAQFFGNGGQESGVLEHPETLSDEAFDHLGKSFAKTEAWRPLILEEGMKWKANAVPPEDMQLIDSRRFGGVEEIARIFRVPLHFIQEQTKSTSWGTGIGELNIGFATHTIGHWNSRIEYAINMQLIEPSQRKRWFNRLNISALLRGDTKAQTDYLMQGIQWGWLSRNDAREIMDMNAREGLDEHLIPLNMIGINEERPGATVADPEQDPEPEPDEGDDSGNEPEPEDDRGISREALRPLLVDVIGWLNTRDFRGEKFIKIGMERLTPLMRAMGYGEAMAANILYIIDAHGYRGTDAEQLVQEVFYNGR